MKFKNFLYVGLGGSDSTTNWILNSEMKDSHIDIFYDGFLQY